MATITEDYVSFETAKLLKEKGFSNNWCNRWYNTDIRDPFPSSVGAIGCLPCPTQQMAMRWLREEKHYYIQIMLDSWALDTHLGYYIVIQDILSDFEEINPVDKVFFKTYEEAVEAAIKYCLEDLI